MKLFGTYSEEAQLARDCARGKTEAQEKLYRMYYRKMFGICMRYGGNRDNAEDMLQDGFIKVLRDIGKFRAEGSLEGWVKRVIVTTCLEQLRKQSRLIPMTDLEQARTQHAGEDVVAQMSSDEIMNLVTELPAGYRTVFNLYAIEGFNHKEIADMLDISEGTSKSQLSRARDMLKRRLHQLKETSYGTAR